MSSTDLLHSALSGFARAFAPLQQAVSSGAAFTGFLAQFGWTLPPADQAKVTAALGDLSGLPADPSALDLEHLVEAIGSAVQTVHKIADSGAPAEFVSTFPRELLDYLAYAALARESLPIFGVLHVAGVLSESQVPADATTGRAQYVQRVVRWDLLGSLADDPATAVQNAYGWGGAFDADGFLRSVGILVRALGGRAAMPAADEHLLAQYYPRDAPSAARPRNLIVAVPELSDTLTATGASAAVKVALLGLGIPPTPDAPAPVDGLAIMPVITGSASDTITISPAVTLTLAGDFLARPVRAELHPGRSAVRITTGDTHVDASARLDAKAPAATPWLVFGQAGSTRFEIATAHVRLAFAGTVDGDVEFTAEVGLDQAALVIDLGEADGFVQDAAHTREARGPVSFTLSWSSKHGFTIGGNPRIAIAIPVQESLGPIEITAFGLALGAADGGVALDTTLTFSATLGPFSAVLQDIGLRTLLRPGGPGNLGNADLGIGFKAPSGIGLAIAAGAISGGGFIGSDPSGTLYTGVLALRAGQIAIEAVGLLDTSPPYSLLVALRATFPAIEIGFGFALVGVGGILALNRRVDVDALRARLASGTAGRILNPQDPIHNAPALLSDLETVFPRANGITVLGPTAQLLWADLVHFDIGVFIELPGPTRIVLLGSAYASIQRDGRAYLNVRVDIVGVIDLQADTAAFDAVLIDSHLLGLLDLTGGAAFRMSWGQQPYAVLSLGGFNSAYDPAPLVFPSTLARIAMVHGKPTDEVYLRFEGYFAVTSNTLQFGAAVDVRLNAGGFSVHGTLSFDALIQFVPFHFEFGIRASVDVEYHGHSLAGLTLTGSLTGPGPVVLYGKVCIELLFFDVCFDHTFTLGPTTPPPLPDAGDLFATLVAELDDPAQLRSAGSPDCYVRLRPPDPTSRVVRPTDALTWEQQRAPLEVLLTRVAGTPLAAPLQVHASSTALTTGASDWFAPGQFMDLTDDQALTRPAFEQLASGLQAGGGDDAVGPGIAHPVNVKQLRLPAPTPSRQPGWVFPSWLVAGHAPAAAQITLQAEQWTVHTATGSTTGLAATQARQLAAFTPQARAVPATDVLAAFTI